MTDDSDLASSSHGHKAWANLTRDGDRTTADAQGSGFRTGTNQISAGVDLYAAGGTLVGIGASHRDTDIIASGGQGTIRGSAAMLYGQQAIGAVLVDGVASYGHDDWSTRRADPTGETANLYGRTQGHDSMVGITARMPIQSGGTRIEPYASVVWQQFDRGGFTEAGDSPAALQVGRLSASRTRVMAGLSLGSSLQAPLLATTQHTGWVRRSARTATVYFIRLSTRRWPVNRSTRVLPGSVAGLCNSMPAARCG